ncbi:MAG: peroxide stress protein YaaA [Saprospiraceae bacterium]|nr:peroxide stress protein YaaA [Candidatus Opimibacter skivensis]
MKRSHQPGFAGIYGCCSIGQTVCSGDRHFLLEDRNGKLQFLSYNAKRSRGWMARYIVDHKIKKSGELKGFDVQGYSYREELSDPKKMVFVR